ncbi:hypothetical protein TTHERM_00409110 (macronuclear) [Tetrahymena thermophila SB210]|uniref:Uncharacterized protein n=1 Tax=Tetrahymena thermophila (strain SB210) TaxID=312017 RepID=I7M922_TETTS|nr:hypothetical protein TTHERM_00409110 [Tetrahymena thermophila SB210]EAS00558.1 hypothetical protein TTHERM_00409110 [Tetrahymena thermophila SB210]|eukprot:XP_001020803.1 hypothetical protein TTHERM_00409110 [Tetrahymena thermophila SB210]
MDTEGIKKAWQTQGDSEEQKVNIDVVENLVDPKCPVELKTKLNNEQEDKLAAFLKKIQMSIQDDDEFDASVKNKILDWKTEIECKQQQQTQQQNNN